MALSAFESARGDNPVRVSKEAMDAIPEDQYRLRRYGEEQ